MWIQLLILELIDGAGTSTVTPTPTTTTPGGVRRARFLRRAPKLPWDREEEEEQQVLVSKPKKRRIPLPEVQAFRKATDGDVPIQTIQEISAPAITIPSLGTARLREVEDEDDDLLLWLI